MIDIKELEHLAPMANEMLSGLHADEAMKRRILFAANEKNSNARNSTSSTAPRMVMIFPVFSFQIFFIPRYNRIPITAPSILSITSVISLAPIKKQAQSRCKENAVLDFAVRIEG